MTLSDNMRAAAMMSASMAAFTINDVLMKLAAPNLPFFEQIFLRGVMISLGLFVLAAMWRQLQYKLSPQDRALTVLRTLAEIVSTVFFLKALMNMPIANLSAILQALPLTVTLAAALFFREQVGWRRMVAIAVGLVGVTIIIRPGAEGFSAYSLYGVAAVVGVTVRDLTSRKLSKSVPSSRVALAAAIGVTTMAAIGSAVTGEHWVMPDLRAWKLIAGAALCLMIGYTVSVAAMRIGEIGFVAPFRYASLIVALLLGLFVFKEWPDGWTLVGAGIVVATGLFTLYRERKSATASPPGVRIR
ncbi:DMT family transporter [Octadecabacter sp. 1_MG-2023]|uniref:DMT family transporter n=1 Tax=unclassified Octadecabacter TaxID=196158 RepID=UPI001C08D9BF|nr:MULTISPECIES: DMT family transporter [unclassified Octadecabacter]MBU2992055.1 DMT family transporter [Octadecabacter sp. B2R22]MDO6736200.1 DMT family transporter [Octadecabacter sp. 1_MG-2023]